MSEKLKGGILVFLGACSFGLLSTIVKTAYSEGYSLGEITGSQTFFGAIILWTIFGIQYVLFSKSRKKQKKQIDPIDKAPATPWWKVMLAGTFTGLVGIFYYQCVKLVPASIAIVLLMQFIWISIVLEAVLFKKKPHKMQLIAVAIVLVGTLFAGGVFGQEIVLNVKGVVFGFLAAICYALFLLTSGRLGNNFAPAHKGALMITGSCILTWIIFPPAFFFNGVFFAGLYKWGIILAILGTVIPPFFFSWGVPKAGISLGAILSAAELPVAVLSSYFILKENVEYLQWLGVAIILFAIILTNIKLKKA